ncbi:hypothetical protein LK10_04665 [Sinomonas humi]|uniref:Asp/Glu racemase n=2 Tax=Sinomonas humi TaxID=1338436 RepID=A0A0B2ARG3_9MICC|nr:hypothetical protein LK10_04665 [Sinomonas humi]
MAESRPTVRPWGKASYLVDGGIAVRAQIGMVVLSSDQTLSYEARAMLDVPGVGLYESRLLDPGNPSQPLTMDLLEGYFDGLGGAIRQINIRRPSDVIALGCTSAAMAIGYGELEQRVQTLTPQARVTDPFTAILSALRALGPARVGFVSPYPQEVAEKMVAKIEAAGHPVPAGIRFHNETGSGRLDAPFIWPASISGAVRQLVNESEVDAVVVACTQMRAAGVLAELERETGKSLISSNQALCWHALRLAGVGDAIYGWGRLFQTEL